MPSPIVDTPPSVPLDAAAELSAKLTSSLLNISRSLDAGALPTLIDTALADALNTAEACVKAIQVAIAYHKP